MRISKQKCYSLQNKLLKQVGAAEDNRQVIFKMGCNLDTETQNCVTILEENWLHVRNIDNVDKRVSQANLENKTYDS